jgi:hypothetical protein
MLVLAIEGIVPFPTFDIRGLLPPFIGTDATTARRSPYVTTMVEVAAQLGTTPNRRQLLRNLIAYRGLLANDGYQSGVQFIDGSFVENIEDNAKRPPGDIDVLSILSVPPKYVSDPTLWTSAGLPFWRTEIADRDKNKVRYSLDTYAFLYEEFVPSPMRLINYVIYWYGLFSHQRSTFAWKGFLALGLDPVNDQAALAALGSGPADDQAAETGRGGANTAEPGSP